MNIITDRGKLTMETLLKEWRKYAPKQYKLSNRLKLTVYKNSTNPVSYKEYTLEIGKWMLIFHRVV